jgi:REP element-mobilizing transposase RayT
MVKDKQMVLSDTGQIAEKAWIELPSHFPFLELDVFVIMPNHIHGILIIKNKICQGTKLNPEIIEEATIDSNSRDFKNKLKSEFMSQISPKMGSISSIIRSYKSFCTNEINKIDPGLNFKWQARFHDHIIRDNQSFQRIQKYILNNPGKWNNDRFYRSLKN